MEIVETAMSYLGVAISNYANILDPDLIIIGGGITDSGDLMFEIIHKEMKKKMFRTNT